MIKLRSYSSSLDLSWYNKKLAKSLRPTTQLFQLSDDEYMIRQETTFKNKDIKFKVGEEIETDVPNGMKAKARFEFKGPNRLLQHTVYGDELMEVERDFTEDQLLVVSVELSDPLAGPNLTTLLPYRRSKPKELWLRGTSKLPNQAGFQPVAS